MPHILASSGEPTSGSAALTVEWECPACSGMTADGCLTLLEADRAALGDKERLLVQEDVLAFDCDAALTDKDCLAALDAYYDGLEGQCKLSDLSYACALGYFSGAAAGEQPSSSLLRGSLSEGLFGDTLDEATGECSFCQDMGDTACREKLAAMYDGVAALGDESVDARLEILLEGVATSEGDVCSADGFANPTARVFGGSDPNSCWNTEDGNNNCPNHNTCWATGTCDCLEALEAVYESQGPTAQMASLERACALGLFGVEPECAWVDVDGCGEYTTVEACSGEFIVDCVACPNADHVRVGGEIEDFSIWAGQHEPVTFTISYTGCNSKGVCENMLRYVTVADKTAPTLSYYSEETMLMEASDYGPYVIGATCQDDCTSLTKAGDGATHGPNADDIDAMPNFSVTPKSYDEFLGLKNDYVTFIDSQQYYCLDTEDNSEGMLGAASAAEKAQDANLLSDVCGVYEIGYSCADMSGNTASATQYVAVVDTTAPDICIGYCTVYYKYKSSVYFNSVVEGATGAGSSPTGLAAVGMAAAAAALVMHRRRSKLRHPEHQSVGFV